MPIRLVYIHSRVPVKIWTDDVDANALEQLHNTASLPFIFKHVAVMPDVHLGFGSTIGSVIPTIKAIIPASIGVDIGCGMIAQKLDMNIDHIIDRLPSIRAAIEAAIPHGRTDNGGANDRGSWHDQPELVQKQWGDLAKDQRFTYLYEKYPKLFHGNVSTGRQLGTLGGGNHFIEVCYDQDDFVWVMLHSGSRGIGNRFGTFFIDRAKEEMERWSIYLPDKDLAYLPEGTELFEGYWKAVSWAQDFAYHNRLLMLQNTLIALTGVLGVESLVLAESAVECHHNYVAKENHYGQNVYITRKGAVRAREGDLGIIPGSMGTKSFIVRGKGNPESFHSCSHGAGRRMARREAARRYTAEDLAGSTLGIESRTDQGVVDEIPYAYKPIKEVMENQTDLVDVVATLRQVICVKG